MIALNLEKYCNFVDLKNFEKTNEKQPLGFEQSGLL